MGITSSINPVTGRPDNIQNLVGYATEDYVDAAIAAIDLSRYVPYLEAGETTTRQGYFKENGTTLELWWKGVLVHSWTVEGDVIEDMDGDPLQFMDGEDIHFMD